MERQTEKDKDEKNFPEFNIHMSLTEQHTHMYIIDSTNIKLVSRNIIFKLRPSRIKDLVLICY